MVELIGASRARAVLAGLVEGLFAASEIVASESGHFEAMERARFASLSGRDVRTGRLEQSLTGPGPDAIRQRDGDDFLFGSSVPYATYNPGVLVRYSGAGTDTVARLVGNRIMERALGAALLGGIL